VSRGDRLEVSRTIAAPADRLFAMVSDLPRMGEWSSENTGGKWVKGATGPVVGARFKGANRNGWRRWSTNVTVVEADPGRAFVFDVTSMGLGVARWGYRFQPVDDAAGANGPAAPSTHVTEFWEDHRSPMIARITGLAVGVPDRTVHNRTGMEATLAALAAAVESPAGR